jgi:hypothetical protein
MTNKTTPDDDWLDLILGNLGTSNDSNGQVEVDPTSIKYVKQAINAKITELLVEELDNIAVKLIKAVGGANYITNIPIERIIELQASQPINVEGEK